MLRRSPVRKRTVALCIDLCTARDFETRLHVDLGDRPLRALLAAKFVPPDMHLGAASSGAKIAEAGAGPPPQAEDPAQCRAPTLETSTTHLLLQMSGSIYSQELSVRLLQGKLYGLVLACLGNSFLH